MLVQMLDPGNHAIGLYRFSRWWHLRGLRPCRWVAHLIYRANLALTGADLPPSASIGERIMMPHPLGVTIGRGVVIGDDVKIMGGVVVGLRSAYLPYDDRRVPMIGNRVFLGANSVVVGEVRVGDDCLIGPCTVVSSSVPSGSVVSARPPLVMRRDNTGAPSALRAESHSLSS